MKANVTVENGNKTVDIKVVGSRGWKGGDCSRIYFELEQSDKRLIFSNFYYIESGTTKDYTIKIGSMEFGYDFGCDVNSHTKRLYASNAALLLAEQIKPELDAMLNAEGDYVEVYGGYGA